jgi:hypothetical protein
MILSMALFYQGYRHTPLMNLVGKIAETQDLKKNPVY